MATVNPYIQPGEQQYDGDIQTHLERNMFIQPYVECPVCYEDITLGNDMWECKHCKKEHCGNCATQMTSHYGYIRCSICRTEDRRQYTSKILQRREILAPCVSPDFIPEPAFWNVNGIRLNTPIQYAELPNREQLLTQIDNIIETTRTNMLRYIAMDICNIVGRGILEQRTERINGRQRIYFCIPDTTLPNIFLFDATVRRNKMVFTLRKTNQLSVNVIGELFMKYTVNGTMTSPQENTIRIAINIY